MNYTIIVFRSRNETMTFYKIIANYGLFCSVINTPRALSASCGVSVKIDRRLIAQSLNILKTKKFSTFNGIYEISFINRKENIKRIY